MWDIGVFLVMVRVIPVFCVPSMYVRWFAPMMVFRLFGRIRNVRVFTLGYFFGRLVAFVRVVGGAGVCDAVWSQQCETATCDTCGSYATEGSRTTGRCGFEDGHPD